MGTLKNACCWSGQLLVFFLAIQITHCIRNEQREEPDYHKIPEHPVVNELSEFDPEPFVPNRVSKPTVPTDVANCKCGEHDFNGTSIELLECGERPWTSNTVQKSSASAPTQLVTNGNFTDKSQFPWVVALVERRSNGSAIHFCGRTLISNKLVLTATHCFTERAINNTEVWLNEKNLLLSTDDHHTIKIQAKRLIIAPKYNPIMNYNDIALVELTEAVDFQDSHLRPICLPYDATFDDKHFAYTAGWGQTTFKGPKSDQLQHVCLPLLSHNQCTQKSVSYYKSRVTEWMICAGDIKNGKRDACPGDSGGPLFVEAGPGTNRHYLVGIVSWGEQCGLPRRPGVYTRVSKYLAWIHQEGNKIQDNKLCG